MIYVRPKEGLRIRHPENLNCIIPNKGMYVNKTTDILRLINDGDLVVVENPPQKSSKGKQAKTKTEGDN